MCISLAPSKAKIIRKMKSILSENYARTNLSKVSSKWIGKNDANTEKTHSFLYALDQMNNFFI